jgi:dTDP-4-amino-4,6-dideoxy-D-galactose acyltransferase
MSKWLNFFERDPWMSSVLMRPVWRLKPPESLPTFPIEPLKFEPGSFAYAKIATNNFFLRTRLQKAGFFLADTSIQLQKKLLPSELDSDLNQNLTIRWALPEDRILVVNLARRSFKYSRFHTDPEFGTPLADEIKAAWVNNFFMGKRGDGILLIEEKGIPVAFLLVLKQSENWIIDLIATDPDFQRQGLARALLNAFESTARHTACVNSLQVGTQIINLPSLKLYQQQGYHIKDSAYIFHYHEALT